MSRRCFLTDLLCCDRPASPAGDAPDRLGRIDDVDALMTAQRQQMLAIPRDDQIDACRDSGGDDLIVIDITDHHTRHTGRPHQLNGLDVVAPYMDVSRKARFGGVKFQEVAALHSAFVCWFYPAGPDGIRGQGSHLIFELKALDDYRIAPAPV